MLIGGMLLDITKDFNMKKIIWIFIFSFIGSSIVFAQKDTPRTGYTITRESDTQVKITKTSTIDVDVIVTLKDLRNKLQDLIKSKAKLDRDYLKATAQIDQDIVQAQANIDEAIRLGIIEEGDQN